MQELYYNKSAQSGQTLIEALIAVAVAVVVVAAAAILTSTSLSSSQTSKNQNLATQFAQEGMELARKERRVAPSGQEIYCLAQDETEFPGTSVVCNIANIEQEYVRKVMFFPIDINGVCGEFTYEVRSSVSWTDGKCSSKFCRNVELVTCLAP